MGLLRVLQVCHSFKFLSPCVTILRIMDFPVVYLGWCNVLGLKGLNDKNYLVFKAWLLRCTPGFVICFIVLQLSAGQPHLFAWPKLWKSQTLRLQVAQTEIYPYLASLMRSLCHDGTQASSVHQSNSELVWISFVLSFYTSAFEISLSHCSSDRHMVVFPFKHFLYSSASLQILIFGAAHALLLNVVLNCADFLKVLMSLVVRFLYSEWECTIVVVQSNFTALRTSYIYRLISWPNRSY